MGDQNVLYDAVRYALDRIQVDPDVRYYCGWGTEIFRRLCLAEAEHRGVPLEEVEKERSRDLQPEHRKRDPEVLTLRRALAVAADDGDDDGDDDEDDEEVAAPLGPLPPPPSSMDLPTLRAWLDSADHGVPRHWHGGDGGWLYAAMCGAGATCDYLTDGRGLVAIDRDLREADEKIECAMARLRATPLAHQRKISAEELSVVAVVPQEVTTHVLVGAALIDARLLRRWVWSVAKASGADDVLVEWGGARDPVRFSSPRWTAVVMPLIAGSADVVLVEDQPEGRP